MTRRQLAILAALAAAVVAIEVDRRLGSDGTVTRASTPAETTAQPRSTKPFVWNVSLDPRGRPYDQPLRRGEKIERRPLAVLHAPSRRVIFTGGENVPWIRADEEKPVVLAERPGRRYRVDAIWAVRKGKVVDEIVGIVIVERDIRIERWRELEPVAYGTDGGMGAITTVEWARLDKREREELFRRFDREFLGKNRQSFAADVDGHPGVDTIIFSNGYGDGGFPSVAGYDASGARAAIVLWTIVAPWRVAFPEGRPPWQVTRRQNEFAACLKGLRKVNGSTCRVVR